MYFLYLSLYINQKLSLSASTTTFVVSHSQNTEMHFTDFSFTPFYCFSIYSNIKSYHNLYLQIPRRFLVSLYRFNKFIARADCCHKGSSVDQWAVKWKNLPSHLQRNFFWLHPSIHLRFCSAMQIKNDLSLGIHDFVKFVDSSITQVLIRIKGVFVLCRATYMLTQQKKVYVVRK